MKWIRNRNKFLNEAKLKNVILPTQAKAVAAKWGEKYLDYEEIEPTDKIIQGRWKLSEEDKIAVLSTFMKCDISEIFNLFDSLPEKFVNFVLTVSTDKVENININKPTLDQLVYIFDPVFKKISLNDTMSSNIISKDENNRPIKDADGNMIRIEKTPGELVLSNNLVNISSVLDDYNKYIENYVNANIGDKYNIGDKLDKDTFDDTALLSYVNLAKTDDNKDYGWKYDIDIFEKDIYLSIKHNPKDILNMSISRFYSSCQHLYTGVYRDQLLANVFDPNSIPAFLIFDTPIVNKEGQKLSDVMPLTRMQIRKVETIDEEKDVKLYFDRCYPDRMDTILPGIVEKYSLNKKLDSISGYKYIYSPDIDTNDDVVSAPYHDHIGNQVIKKRNIGLNITSLNLVDLVRWDNFVISNNNKLRELVIETTVLPDNLLKIKLDLEWVKFKYLKLDSLDPFSKISYSAIAFEKCKFDNNIFDEIARNTPIIKKIKLISCNNGGVPNFRQFENLEELHFIYTLDSIDELKQAIEGVNLKKLGISGDLITKENKQFFGELKSKGIKIEVIGPSI